jgi:hypothetical protein
MWKEVGVAYFKVFARIITREASFLTVGLHAEI